MNVDGDHHKVCHEEKRRVGQQRLGKEQVAWFGPEGPLVPEDEIHEEVDGDEGPYQQLHQGHHDVQTRPVVALQQPVIAAAAVVHLT